MTVIIFGSFNKMGPAFGAHADEAFQSPLCCIHAVLGAFGAERVIWWLLEGIVLFRLSRILRCLIDAYREMNHTPELQAH